MHLDVHHRLLVGVSSDRAGVFVLEVADHGKVPAPGIDCGIDVSFQSREKLAFAVALAGHAVVAQVATVYFNPGLRCAFFDFGDGAAPTHMFAIEALRSGARVSFRRAVARRKLPRAPERSATMANMCVGAAPSPKSKNAHRRPGLK